VLERRSVRHARLPHRPPGHARPDRERAHLGAVGVVERHAERLAVCDTQRDRNAEPHAKRPPDRFAR
jgi:hypothetical protein